MTSETLFPPVIDYLLGSGPLDDCHYPDNPQSKPKYWWRKSLREAWQTRAPEHDLIPRKDVDALIEAAMKIAPMDRAAHVRDGFTKININDYVALNKALAALQPYLKEKNGA